jgi:exonuclease SbcC
MFKLISLRASGFKRLNIEEKLEFPDGRLLVHGRNESGKSTLMEAIHYALYGMPLRPSKNAGNEDVIRYGRENAIVELEFSIDGIQYQVRRELHRKKTNIHILNKREQGENLSRITTGARNVNRVLGEILHGIDSDALLNSCLVEQKELGKLEDANKQERIKAMSSLLNLEAFIDARDELKKECRELDKIHSNTLMELQKAEHEKQENEIAENRKEAAEKRLTEIAQEKIEVEENLEKLREQLEIINQMKTHQTRINKQRTELNGKQENLKLQQETLSEIDKAEQELQNIEERLPEIEKTVSELDKQIETLQRLSELHENLRVVKSRLETINVRLSKTQQEYNEAIEARGRTQELTSQIQIYSPVKTGDKKLEELTRLFNEINSEKNEINRLEKELEVIQERLDETKDSEELIQRLEEQETVTKNMQKRSRQ